MAFLVKSIVAALVMCVWLSVPCLPARSLCSWREKRRTL